MISVPQMVMIGGNSRNSGKTTMACSIIRNLCVNHDVIGLKVTSVRPGEEEFHGKHEEDVASNFTIFEEIDTETHKDTSKMLKAGATHVYYIRVAEAFIEQAILHFLSKYINKQIIVCESRSLRGIIIPGLFLMMVKLPLEGKEKDISKYITKADKVFNFAEDLEVIRQYTSDLNYANDKFVFTDDV